MPKEAFIEMNERELKEISVLCERDEARSDQTRPESEKKKFFIFWVPKLGFFVKQLPNEFVSIYQKHPQFELQLYKACNKPSES